MRRRLAALALAAALGVLGACGDGDDAGSAEGVEPFALRPVLAESRPPCAKGLFPERKDGETVGCLELGPAIVDTGDVRSAALGRTPGGPSVSVVLGQVGSANLDDFAGRSMGKRLAILVDGRVVRAPAIQTASFIGRVEVVGLSEEEAEKLLKDLDGATGG